MRLYVDHELEMCNALAADLQKSRQEAIINEVELLRNDLRNLLMNLKDYAKPEKVKRPHPCTSFPNLIQYLIFYYIHYFIARKITSKCTR